MDYIIRQNFPIVTHFNHQNLAGPLALMFSGVLVTTAKTESVGCPEFALLPLACILVAARSWGRRCASLVGVGCRWRWPAHWDNARALQTLLLQFFFLNPREHSSSRDACWGLQTDAQSQFILQAEEELRDEELGVDGWVEREQVIHLLIERRAVLGDCGRLTELQQLVHDHLELVGTELLEHGGREYFPGDAAMCLMKCLQPVRCLAFDVQLRGGHPIVWCDLVEFEVRQAAIQPQVRGGAIEPRKSCFGGLW